MTTLEVVAEEEEEQGKEAVPLITALVHSGTAFWAAAARSALRARTPEMSTRPLAARAQQAAPPTARGLQISRRAFASKAWSLPRRSATRDASARQGTPSVRQAPGAMRAPLASTGPTLTLPAARHVRKAPLLLIWEPPLLNSASVCPTQTRLWWGKVVCVGPA